MICLIIQALLWQLVNSLFVAQAHSASYCCPVSMNAKKFDAMISIMKAAGWLSKAMDKVRCLALVEVTSTERRKLVKD